MGGQVAASSRRSRRPSRAEPAASSRALGGGVGVGVGGDVGVELARRSGSRPARCRRCRAGRSRRCRSASRSGSPEDEVGCGGVVVPGAPGPPGLTTSEPMRSLGSAAGTLSRASSIVCARRVGRSRAAPRAWRTRSRRRTAPSRAPGRRTAASAGSGGAGRRRARASAAAAPARPDGCRSRRATDGRAAPTPTPRAPRSQDQDDHDDRRPLHRTAPSGSLQRQHHRLQRQRRPAR